MSSANEVVRTPSLRKMASALRAIGPAGSAATGVEKEPVDKVGRARALRIMRVEGPGLVRMLWRLLGCEADVMDAFQDCLCKLATIAAGRKLANERAYAYRTAANIAIELIRARNRRRAHWPDIVEKMKAESQARGMRGNEAQDDRFEELRASIAMLPPHLRNTIVLRDLNRLSYEEVGKALGIDPATARVYRRHAVIKLAQLLGGESESCPS